MAYPRYKGDEPELPKKAGKKASKKAGQKRTPSKKRAPKAQEVDVAANGEFGWTAPPPMPQEPLSPEDEARRELFEAERWRTEEAEAEEEQRQRQRTLDEMEDRDIVSRRKQQTVGVPWGELTGTLPLWLTRARCPHYRSALRENLPGAWTGSGRCPRKPSRATKSSSRPCALKLRFGVALFIVC